MKKVIIGMLIFSLLLVACGQDDLTEEELRAQIEEELRAEIENDQQNSNQEQNQSTEDKQGQAPVEENVNNDNNMNQSVVAMASKLNLRDSSGLSGNVITTVTKDSDLQLLEKAYSEDGFNWYKVSNGEQEGWIAAWFCITENELKAKTGRGHLIDAFDGHFEAMTTSVEENRKAVISELGLKYDEEYANGGSYLAYDDYSILLYGTSFDGKKEGDIASIIYHGEDEMFGIKNGMTAQNIKSQLGEPNLENIYFDESGEGFYADGTLLLHYYTGSYMLTLIFTDGEHLSSMMLDELNMSSSSSSNTSRDNTPTVIAGLKVAKYKFEYSDFEIQLEGTLKDLSGSVSKEDWYESGEFYIVLRLDQSSYDNYTFDNGTESVTLAMPSSFFILNESDLDNFSESQLLILENGGQLIVNVDISNFGLEAKIGSESGHNKGDIVFTSIE